MQRGTEPKVRHVAGAPPAGSAIRQRPVQIITLALIFVGSIFATAEVSVVAITKELGQPICASLVIGVYAVGSFVVGLILGALNQDGAAASVADRGRVDRALLGPLLFAGSR